MLIGIFYSQIVESSSLVSVLFREAISHPYISFFHLLVNGFSVIITIIIFIIIINFFRRVFLKFTEVIATSLTPLETIFPEECAFIIGFSCTVWTKMESFCWLYMVCHLNSSPPTNYRKVRSHQKGTETKDACQRLILHPYIIASRTSS